MEIATDQSTVALVGEHFAGFDGSGGGESTADRGGFKTGDLNEPTFAGADRGDVAANFRDGDSIVE